MAMLLLGTREWRRFHPGGEAIGGHLLVDQYRLRNKQTAKWLKMHAGSKFFKNVLKYIYIFKCR